MKKIISWFLCITMLAGCLVVRSLRSPVRPQAAV